MKILDFSKNFLYFFFDPRFYPNVEKFRLLDHVIMLHAAILGMTLKDLVSVCSQ